MISGLGNSQHIPKYIKLQLWNPKGKNIIPFFSVLKKAKIFIFLLEFYQGV